MKVGFRVCRFVTLNAALSSFGGLAQIPPPPLANVEVSVGVTADPATKIYSYRYRLTNPSQNVLSIASVDLDITMPENSIRPTGSSRLPAGLWFRDPDGPTGFPPGGFKYETWGDYYRARTGLNFVPVGLDGPAGWARHVGVSQTNKFALLPNVIAASWSGLSETLNTIGIVPGASLDGLVVTSYGLPGIRSMELQPKEADLSLAGQIPEEWQTTEDDTPAGRLQKRKSIKGLGFLTKTLGPTALPAGYTNASLVTRLQGLVDQATGLSWMTDPLLAQQLTGLLTQASAALQQNQNATAKTLLQQFVTAVTSASLAQRRQEASDLLSLNAQFIIDHITVVLPTAAILSPRNVSMKVRQVCFAFSDSRMRRSWLFSVVGPGHVEGAVSPQAG
jgi:hypothetical protein